MPTFVVRNTLGGDIGHWVEGQPGGGTGRLAAGRPGLRPEHLPEGISQVGIRAGDGLFVHAQNEATGVVVTGVVVTGVVVTGVSRGYYTQHYRGATELAS